MKKILLCLLAPATMASAQNIPINLQTGPVITLPAGATPSALAIADFNQDYRSDVAVCQRGLGTVGVYLQSAAGSFPAPSGSYDAGIAPSGLVAVALGNTQSRASADLVAISAQSSLYTLLRNNTNGTGTFTPVVSPFPNSFGTTNLAANPQLIATDLNRDGMTEFAYSYDPPASNASAGLYLRPLETPIQVATRNITFQGTSYRPSCFALADFDRDGTVDVVAGNPTGNTLNVYFSSASGSYPAWGIRRAVFPSGDVRPVSVAARDVNNDYLPDLAVAHSSSAEVTLHLNLSNDQFGSASKYAVAGIPQQVLFADLNNDQRPELLVLTATNQLQVFQHTGASGVTRYGTPITVATGANPITMQLADIDGDFVDDIVVGCANDNTVRVYLNKSLTLGTRPRLLANVTVYPNPATDQLIVESTAPKQGPLTITLLDALGRQVRRTESRQASTALAVADLPRGLYVLRLADAHASISQRIVLQ